MTIYRAAISTLALLVLSVSALAQERRESTSEKERYVVSAKAGALSYLQGHVTYKSGSAEWKALAVGHSLIAGDIVRTEGDGLAEVLLNPGAYIRISPNTELALIESQIRRLEFNLLKGSAIVEASIVVGWITIATPAARFAIVTAGLFRFNVAENGETVAIARWGRIIIDGKTITAGEARALSGGVRLAQGSRVAIQSGLQTLSIVGDKKGLDTFDSWSRNRARTIIASNKSLRNKRILSGAAASMLGSVWVYNDFFSCYTFLPGFYNVYSAYGYRYEIVDPRGNYGWSNLQKTGYCTNCSPKNYDIPMILDELNGHVLPGPGGYPGSQNGGSQNRGYPGSAIPGGYSSGGGYSGVGPSGPSGGSGMPNGVPQAPAAQPPTIAVPERPIQNEPARPRDYR